MLKRFWKVSQMSGRRPLPIAMRTCSNRVELGQGMCHRNASTQLRTVCCLPSLASAGTLSRYRHSSPMYCITAEQNNKHQTMDARG